MKTSLKRLKNSFRLAEERIDKLKIDLYRLGNMKMEGTKE